MTNEIADQIGDMLKNYETATEDNEQVTNEGNEEVQEDVQDEQVSDEQTETPTESESSDIAQLKADYEELKLKLSNLSKVEPKVDEPLPIPEQDFIGDGSFEEVLEDPKKFNSLMNKLFVKAVEFTRNELSTIRQAILREVPQQVTTIDTIRKASDNFYKANPDLSQFKGAVAAVYKELSDANPTLTYVQLLEKTEVETRKRLGLTKQSKQTSPTLPKRTRQARQSTQTKETNPLLDDIDKMNAALL